MTDHAEEQEMEAEALEAIFESHFSCISPTEWSIELYPTLDEENHVACRLLVKLPAQYPEELPQLSIEVLKGLAEATHQPILKELADDTARQNLGLPAVYAIAEAIKDWLLEHNRPGLDDTSMHAQMMMRRQETQATSEDTEVVFESHTQQETLTQAEQEELLVNQKRNFGTPCTLENFEAWKVKFDAEMASTTASTTAKDPSKEARPTGYQQFRGKTTDLEALERAAEDAENDEAAVIDEDEVDEELFEDDVDLDDLDFDDDDVDI